MADHYPPPPTDRQHDGPNLGDVETSKRAKYAHELQEYPPVMPGED